MITKGHLKLIDFGLSEVGLQGKLEDNIEKEKTMEFPNHTTKKVLGTANYIAPEMIIDDGEITEAVDYWALGVILYELYTEELPFYSNTVSEIFDNIINCRIDWEVLKNAEFISEDAYDLIKLFLVFDKDQRWSFKDIKKIKEHRFFSGVDWSNVKKTSNILLKRYVCAKIKKESEENAVKKNDSNPNIPGFVRQQSNVDYCSRKIDNLYEKNLALIKSNINVGKKVLEVELEGLGIKDFIDDLDS